LAVRLEVAERATLTYLPGPTVITGRAWHLAELVVELAGDAGLRCREVLVLGRTGERPGRLTSTIDVRRGGRPVLRQRLDIGDPELDGALAHLAGHRVLATELLIDDRPVPPPASGDWWARTPLATCGWTATALGDDAVTALRRLECTGVAAE
jgi:urease accessory protein